MKTIKLSTASCMWQSQKSNFFCNSAFRFKELRKAEGCGLGWKRSDHFSGFFYRFFYFLHRNCNTLLKIWFYLFYFITHNFT